MISTGPTHYSIVKFVKGFGQSLLHWINYLHAVDRSKIINEYAIRYATSEYLETKVRKVPENLLPGDFCPTEYQFEEPFPIFNDDRKHADLHVFSRDEKEEVNAEIFMEFKYLKDDSNRLSEYKKDIFRLAVLKKNKPEAYAFFLIATANESSLNDAPIIYEDAEVGALLKDVMQEQFRSEDKKVNQSENCSTKLISTDSSAEQPSSRTDFPYILITEKKTDDAQYQDKNGKLLKKCWVVNDEINDIADFEEITTKLIYAPAVSGNISIECDGNSTINDDNHRLRGLRVFIWEIGVRQKGS